MTGLFAGEANFCPKCGRILPLPELYDTTKCRTCPYQQKISSMVCFWLYMEYITWSYNFRQQWVGRGRILVYSNCWSITWQKIAQEAIRRTLCTHNCEVIIRAGLHMGMQESFMATLTHLRVSFISLAYYYYMMEGLLVKPHSLLLCEWQLTVELVAPLPLLWWDGYQ